MYALTNRATVSAGKDFLFVLQNLKRATLVGDRTGGAGHNNIFLRITRGFTVSMSITRVLEPATGREWESVGVIPDIATPPESALAVTHIDALRKPIQKADAAARPVLTVIQDGVRARYAARAVAASVLQRYVGTYAPERTVTVARGTLRIRRMSAAPEAGGNYAEALAALTAWIVKNRPVEAQSVLSKGERVFNGATAGVIMRLLRECGSSCSGRGRSVPGRP